MKNRLKDKKIGISFIMIIFLLFLMFFISINVGGLQVTASQLFRGLFIKYDKTVATIYNLRFPRVFIAILAGAGISASGVLFQGVLKNPLADPGIIGVSSGAGLFGILVSVFLPQFYYLLPIASLIGALVAFSLVYSLSWKEGLSPVRIILVGVAVEAMFRGISTALTSMSGNGSSPAAAINSGNITLKTWGDVKVLSIYIGVGLILALLQIRSCNYMGLEDKTVRGIGVNINVRRVLCSLTGVLLAGIAAGYVGSITFLGLIAPHMARMLVGQDHKYLLPFSMLLGSFLLLFADTLGRWIAYPHEISAMVIMSIVGGPFFIFMLKRSKK
ncbi:MAG TPA: iron ABC transporter permease [Candidatus Merdenecus merdavium]|nr:iron ABC transporter permease [Candidatus Merdenecus merdavium]